MLLCYLSLTLVHVTLCIEFVACASVLLCKASIVHSMVSVRACVCVNTHTHVRGTYTCTRDVQVKLRSLENACHS